MIDNYDDVYCLCGNELVHGYVDDAGFRPDYGLSYNGEQGKLYKRMKPLLSMCREKQDITLTGGTWRMAIDNEEQYTKVVFHCLMMNDIQEITFVSPIIHGIDDRSAIRELIKNCFATMGIKRLVGVKVKYSLLYEDEIGVVSPGSSARNMEFKNVTINEKGE